MKPGYLLDALSPKATTKYLRPDDEAKYRAWLQAIGQTPGSGYNIDPSWTGTDYDYRGFFDKYGPADIAKGQHFTDEFKLPNHPSFSNESVYATGNAAPYAGQWDENTYKPSLLGMILGRQRFTE